MPNTFNETVAARTRTADHILNTPDLFALYTQYGGLPGDLEAIFASGRRAEALSQARSAAQADGSADTVDVLQCFSALQREYVVIMAVLQAVQHDLKRAGAPAQTLAAVEKILVNEAPVVIRSVEKEGVKKKVAVRSKSQEGLRAEIQKDASAILENTDIANAMAARNITPDRLSALRNAATALSGKLAERSSSKGAGKGATQEVHKAVAEQKLTWSACYRILALVGRDDERVRSLLADASAKR